MKSSRAALMIVACLSVTVVALGGLPHVHLAGAQLPTPLPVSPSPILGESPSPSPSPPSPSPSKAPPPPDSPPPAGGSPAPEPPPPQPQYVPPAAPARGFPLQVPVIARTPSRTTDRLASLLTPLVDRGMPLEEAMIFAAPPFPVAGLVWFADDWMFARVGPPLHLHEGTDIFAAAGTPIVASAPGYVAALGVGSLGGVSAWVVADNADAYYYAHLLSYSEGLHVGQRVEVGTVIGYVGNTGNAVTTSPHLHFEIHPAIWDAKGRLIAGGVSILPEAVGRTNAPAVNPKPYLDAWLYQAELRAETLVIRLVERFAGITRQIHFSQKLDQLYSTDAVRDPGVMAWLSAYEPVLASLGIARRAALESIAGSLGGSVAERKAEEARMAAIAHAVARPRLEFASLTGMVSPY